MCFLFSTTVVYAYEQCLQTMGFHSNVWCEAALYLEKVSQQLMDKGVCFFFYLVSTMGILRYILVTLFQVGVHLCQCDLDRLCFLDF